ncbi:hypothetical protein AMJ86_00320 [bacterium SM23_57]|nr:MAG: hypothetical protein AMJ86_00320 [bacterium SM23_57]
MGEAQLAEGFTFAVPCAGVVGGEADGFIEAFDGRAIFAELVEDDAAVVPDVNALGFGFKDLIEAFECFSVITASGVVDSFVE